jgi:rhodanese-related sulfurtransferase
MLRRLVNLPFSLATRAARAFQEREDARTRDLHAATEAAAAAAAASLSDRVGNAADLGTFDATNCRMDLERARALAGGTQPVAWVDVRAVLDGRALPGAIHMPVAEANVRVSELPPDVPVVVYCEDGRESARATVFFRERGMEETWWLAGGLAAWHAGRAAR